MIGGDCREGIRDMAAIQVGNMSGCRSARGIEAMKSVGRLLLVWSLLLMAHAQASEPWGSADWPAYIEFVESLKTMTDAELTELTESPPVVYGFLLAAGEVLDAIALSQDVADYPVQARRHAHRCAYRYLSDRITYQYAPGNLPGQWPYGGVVVIAQSAFDDCLVINIESEDADDPSQTRYLEFVPPERPPARNEGETEEES